MSRIETVNVPNPARLVHGGAKAVLLLACLVGGCAPGDVPLEDEGADSREDGATGGIAENTREARGVLVAANQLGFDLLTDGAHLSERAAENLVAYRLGDDGVAPSADDEQFDTLKEIDAVPLIGPAEFAALLKFARKNGFVEPATVPAASGEVIWGVDVGTKFHAGVNAIASDRSDNVIFAGTFGGTLRVTPDAEPLVSAAGSTSMFVAKLDAQGGPVWSRSFGESDSQPFVLVDERDEMLLSFRSESTVDLGCGPVAGSGSVIAKLDADGDCLWSRRVPFYLHYPDSAIALAPDGRVAITGTVLAQGLQTPNGTLTHNWTGVVTLDPSGATRAAVPWPHSLRNASLAFGPSGELAVSGYANPIDFGGGLVGGPNALHIAVFDDHLEHVWSRGFAVASANSANALAVDPDGGVVLATAFKGWANLGGTSLGSDGSGNWATAWTLVARFTPEGAHLWSTATNLAHFGNSVYPRKVHVVDGVVYVSAYLSLGWSGSGHLLKLNAGGREVWQRELGSTITSAMDSAGRLLVSGDEANQQTLGLVNSGAFVGVLTP